jgi:A118 family predicted phage portal protein
VFTRLLSWIREVFKKVIRQSDVKERLHLDVAISSTMATALNTWSLMYANQAAWLTEDVISLGLPAAIAGDVARAVTIEMAVEVSGSPRAVFLQAQYDLIAPKLRPMLEYGLAKGGLVMKPYVNGNQIAVDFVQADQFYPIKFDANGGLTSCVFADQKQIGDTYYTRLELHEMGKFMNSSGNLVEGSRITQYAFKSSDSNTLGNKIDLASVEAWASLEENAIVENIDRPLFAYYRVPLGNNIDTTSPLGVAIYARATELIQQADEQWSRLIWEFESGKRAIYVDPMAFGLGTDGKPLLPDKRLFRTATQRSGAIGEGTGEDLFHDWTPEFRDAAIRAGLDAILKRIEFNCGLAYGVLSDPQSVEKTATEIAATKQRSQATIRDNQKALQATLNHLFYAMDVYATLYNLAPKGAYKVGYDWDDSLIVDSEAQFTQDQRTSIMGAMPKYIFLMRNYGLTEENARKWIADQQAEAPKDMFQNEEQGA